jgi:DNA-directed RNA polymerase alpha subunit
VADVISSFLEVGANSCGEVIVNGSKAAIDANGDWHIVFSERQARSFGNSLIRAAGLAHSLTGAKIPINPGTQMKPTPPLSAHISVLYFSVRARKVMNLLAIDTVGKLLEFTGSKLREQKNFGPSTLIEVENRLAEYGLKLKEETQNG